MRVATPLVQHAGEYVSLEEEKLAFCFCEGEVIAQTQEYSAILLGVSDTGLPVKTLCR